MDIIPIDKKRVMVSLSKDDLEKFSLSADKLDCSDVQTKDALRRIVGQAKKEAGFDLSSKSRTLLQIFLSPNGGCDMFITGVSNAADNSGAESGFTERPEYDLKEEPTGASEGAGEYCTYRFASLDDLINACRLLSERGFCDESSAYCIGETYFLALHLPEVEENDSRARAFRDILCEFGEYIEYPYSNEIIGEHGVRFCRKRASVRLSRL